MSDSSSYTEGGDNALSPIGVAKVVKLGTDTLLVIKVSDSNKAPEGDYKITKITANPIGPTLAPSGCIIQVN